ncbi:MAG: AraC family transcriptional regulator, partial [Bacteroidota bacterium]
KSELQGSLLELDSLAHFERLMALLCILQHMAQSKDYELLGADKSSLVIKDVEYNRINIVYDYVQTHFQQDIVIADVANHVNMTLPAFCWFFKQVTEKTFTEFVNEFRVSYACELISQGELSISEISYQCGFQSVSYFNRRFKGIIGVAPLKYRSQFQKIVSKI